MIAIINYEAGNLASVSNALKRLDVPYTITDDKDELEEADGVIFPGVGHAEPAMESLKKNNLAQWLIDTEKPVLGICLGMQLLFESSEEGDSEGLGIIPGRLNKFDSSKAKVPHMGWNTFDNISRYPIIDDISKEDYFYFVHSYYAPVNDFTVAICHYTHSFAAVVAKENYVGVQFHPEKSGEAGSLMLQNFLMSTKKSSA